MRRALILLVLASILFVPASNAQYSAPTVDVRAYAPSGPLLPEVEQADVKISVTVACPLGYVSTEPVTVNLGMKAMPPYANVVLNPVTQSLTFQPTDCILAGASRTVSFRALITITRDAPAYYDGQYDVVATVQQPGHVSPNSAQQKASFTIKNGYVALVRAEAQTLFQEVAPNEVAYFPVNIANLGNGPSRTHIDIVQPGPATLDMINPGADLALESRAGKGASAMYQQTRVIEAMADSQGGIYTFEAIFRSVYDGIAENSMTDETRINFGVHVVGNATESAEPKDAGVEYASAPMVPILALLMLGVAALRRRL